MVHGQAACGFAGKTSHETCAGREHSKWAVGTPGRWAHLIVETASEDLDARTKALEARPLPTRSPRRDRALLDATGGAPLLREDQALSMGEK